MTTNPQAVASATKPAAVATPERFLDIIHEKLLATEQVFHDSLATDVPFISDAGEYIFAGGGKRVRREVDYTAQDIRFTTKGEALYAICLDWPGDDVVIESLGSESSLLEETIAEVVLVGHGKSLSFSREPRGLVVTMPEEKPCECAYSLKITLK